jgi:hypothetical protein
LLEDLSGNELSAMGVCHFHACVQPIFEYGESGEIAGNSPVAARHLWWEDNLFGLPQLFTWGLPTDITPAPYRPMSPCDESFVCNAFESWGWNFTNVGLLHDFTSWFADETYSLMVVWMPVEWASYKSINDLFDGAPSGFSYASHARIPGHGR